MNNLAPELWVVSELYYPEETSTGYFVTGIAEGLAATFRTAVLCSRPTYGARHLAAPSRERKGGVDIIRCWSTRLDPHRLVPRAMNLATITISVFATLCCVLRRGQVVIVVTNPPTLPFVAAAACRLRGAKCVLLVHDVYPEVLAAVGLMKPSSFFFRALTVASGVLYRGVERVVVLGRDMQRVALGRLRDAADHTALIPNWGDIEFVHPWLGANPLREQLGLAGTFIVQYSGNIGRTHDLASILDAADTLREDASLHFLIIGWGALRAEVGAAIRARNLRNVTLHPPVPRAELPAALGAADVAVVALLPGMTGLSVPSRMYNILAAGKPVIAIAERDSEVGLLVEEERIGWVVNPSDAGALVAAIGEARRDPKWLAEMGARARRCAEARYSRQHIIDAWTRLIKDVCDGS